jgi:hypothetical protein
MTRGKYQQGKFGNHEEMGRPLFQMSEAQVMCAV